MECPNKEEANKQTKLVKKLSNQAVGLSSLCHYIFYTDIWTNSILGTNTCTKSANNTVKHLNAIILHISLKNNF